jgi:NAD(P)-dependent dehydrogenase (short-subunit alcohol dehydrogenase family)
MDRKAGVDRRTLLTGAAMAAALPMAAQATPAPLFSADRPAPDLSGRTILITGCSSGFGRLGAEHYARLGARVFATMRRLPRPEAKELRDLAEADDLDIEVVEIDILSDRSVERGVRTVLERTGGRLDVLVNNAGIGITGPVELQDMQATQLAFDTNVYGAHRMVRAVLPAMRAQGSGVIIPISSQLGRLIVPGAGHYSATKFALEAMNEQLAYELVAHGIDVAIIQPGGYPTEIWKNRNRYTSNLKDRLEDERLAAYPQMAAAMGEEDGSGRTADPMDVPRAIAAIIAMPSGSRPLRTPVHPGRRPQEPANAALAEAQLDFLGNSPYGPLIRDVLER